MHDAKRPVGRRLGVVAQDDVLADENGVGLVESSVQADGAVLVYAALGLEEEEVEVCGGVAVAHGGTGERPLLEGRAALEAAMGGVLWYSPSLHAQRLRFSVWRLSVSDASRWASQPARSVRNQRSVFPFPAG